MTGEAMGGKETSDARGSQTLRRGLDILELIAGAGPVSLRDISQRMGLTRSTAHRLAAALVERDLARQGPQGYGLGAKVLALAETARLQRPLTTLARPHLEQLAREQLDPVNLAIRDGDRVRYMDQVRGGRRMEVRSVVGETRDLATSGLGRALLLDQPEAVWRRAFGASTSVPGGANAEADWIDRMRQYRDQGATFDIEENEDRVRCVAAPIRDASGRIVAAVSLSSLPQYLDDTRMADVVAPVVGAANAIAAELGWTPPTLPTASPVQRA
jgi:DNA-binding IclR family transcriptional regulator